MAAIDTWVLDGVDLTATNFSMMEFTADPPKAKPEWISAADSEWAALARQPMHENRVVTMRLRVRSQASMDAALDQVGVIIDKFRNASRSQDGIALVWTPANSTRSVTFDVLHGEILEIPVSMEGQGRSWLMQRPIFTVEMTCKPYWRGTESLTSTTTVSLPVVSMEVTNSVGDIPGLGRLIVTDAATQNRRDVEWGMENRTYNASTSLYLDSDNMVTSGFAGIQTTRSGAHDPGGSGNSVVSALSVYSDPITVCGTGTLSHVGTFRVWARAYVSAPSQSLRLVWRVGDGQFNRNNWAKMAVRTGEIVHGLTSQWVELDLGLINVPTAQSGTQRWDGRLEAFDDNPAITAAAALDIDYLVFVPVDEGYGRARATYTFTPGTPAALDLFTGSTSGAALNSRVLPFGGTWTTSGVATDFAFSDLNSRETIVRSTQSEASPRFAIIGATNYTDTSVVGTYYVDWGLPTTAFYRYGVIARWTSSSQYLFAALNWGTTSVYLQIGKVIGGTETILKHQQITGYPGSLALHNIRLTVQASGRISAILTDVSGAVMAPELVTWDAVAATGGTAASGKPGIMDRHAGTPAMTRYLDGIAASVPGTDLPVVFSGQSIEFRHNSVLREDSAGTYYGFPPSYRGTRVLVPTGTSRVAAKVRRVDLNTEQAVDNVTDSTSIQMAVTPRGLVVPRA